jgi:hypothetical protein
MGNICPLDLNYTIFETRHDRVHSPITLTSTQRDIDQRAYAARPSARSHRQPNLSLGTAYECGSRQLHRSVFF